MKINYVIATYNGKCKRNHKYPLPENVLKYHLQKILSLNNNLSQITVMKASSNNYYKDYYNINDIIKESNIPIKIIECENFGYSEGQWLKAYEIYKNQFDYYLFIEDDYCPNMENFEELLIECYKNKFPENIGLLCSLVQGNKDYKIIGGYPIHFEGCVVLNNETFDKLYQFPKWNGNPRKYLDLIDISIDDGFNWEKIRNSYIGGYYQLTFSHLFTLSNIEHEDYLDLKKYDNLLQFPYWNDSNNKIGGEIWFYDKDSIIRKLYFMNDIYNSPIIPIQLHDNTAIKFNTNIIYFDQLYNFYVHIKKTNLYEWISNGNMDFLELLNYRENYPILLNNLGTTLNIDLIPNKGKYKNNNVKISKGLNFVHDKDMYNNEFNKNSEFIKNLRELFYANCKHIDEEFICITPCLNLPGLKFNNKIIPINFYRQGIQFDFIIENIYSKFDNIDIILEIGAGLGNMAHFQKKYNTEKKYIILDIPHTLLIQYHFLQTIGYNVLLLKDEELHDINNIIMNSEFDILLILPHHIKNIKDNIIDLVLNFDSLVEMNKTTIETYLDNILRISKFLYTVNKNYAGWEFLKNKIDNLVLTKKMKILKEEKQVFGSGSQYWFHIALSEGYFIYFIKKV